MFTIPQEAAQKVERNNLLRTMVKNKEVEIRVVSMLDADPKEASRTLLELRGLFQKQLPKMPKDYVTRLVFDLKHKSMVIFSKKEDKIVGGICFRAFHEDFFAEIVFCAVDSESQIRGYGEFMMNMLKKTVREEFVKEAKKRKEKLQSAPIYLLTYADNYAIGYFKKQGFTKEITFNRWKGRIKDYEGGTLMQGKILPGLDYSNTYVLLLKRREAVLKMLRKMHPEMYREYSLGDRRLLNEPGDIPGLREAGYTKEMEEGYIKNGGLKELLMYLCTELQNHKTSWPFLEPVNGKDVQDYYLVIKTPMDLKTVEEKIQNDRYSTFEEMDADIRLIISNCCKYNAPGTQYVKCAKSLDEFYQNKVKWCRGALTRRME